MLSFPICRQDFEAWNNLAHGYVKLGDKRRAFFAFHVQKYAQLKRSDPLQPCVHP